MRTYDFSPLFRYSVGFDRIENLMASAMSRADQSSSYPPYNIESVGESTYRITMAVAGFRADDIEVVLKESTLTVKSAPESKEEPNLIYRGIARRAFERRFQLADHIRVTGAELRDGLLNIELEREIPEGKKPQVIPIQTRATKHIEAASSSAEGFVYSS